MSSFVPERLRVVDAAALAAMRERAERAERRLNYAIEDLDIAEEAAALIDLLAVELRTHYEPLKGLPPQIEHAGQLATDLRNTLDRLRSNHIRERATVADLLLNPQALKAAEDAMDQSLVVCRDVEAAIRAYLNAAGFRIEKRGPLLGPITEERIAGLWERVESEGASEQ